MAIVEVGRRYTPLPKKGPERSRDFPRGRSEIRRMIDTAGASESVRISWEVGMGLPSVSMGEIARMARGEDDCPPHDELTRRSQLAYCFSVKHHRHDDRDDAQWALDLTGPEEFAIFDLADFHDLSDPEAAKRNLYGLRIGPGGLILDLGTRHQQVAGFPEAHPNQPWHGYPLWPLRRWVPGPANRMAQAMRPPKVVFERMEAAGLLSRTQRKRLFKGDHL